MDVYAVPRMNVKTAGDAEYLFVEAGGFSEQNPAGWKAPLIVLKRIGT